MGHRYETWYIDMVIYSINTIILDIDMGYGYGLMIWETTVLIWISCHSAPIAPPRVWPNSPRK